MDFTINLIEQALDGAAIRQKLIADNIANVNTPGYKRKDLSFKDVLKSTINSGNTLKLKTTNREHIGFKSGGIYYKSMNSNNKRYKNDDNNVDIDTEMASMAQNNLYYNTLIQRLSGKFSLLKQVIEKGGN